MTVSVCLSVCLSVRDHIFGFTFLGYSGFGFSKILYFVKRF